jgi:hypothetical protein
MDKFQETGNSEGNPSYFTYIASVWRSVARNLDGMYME